MSLISARKLSLLCYLSFSSSVLSEENYNSFGVSLEDLLNLEVSIASKNDMSLKNSPSSVTIFTQDDIEQYGFLSWVQLLGQVPGFYSMMNPVEGNQSHLIMRGHAQKYANTLLVLLNGHRINDDYTGGINYLIRYMDLTNVERVEVIRGPGSAIYGSNAFSGVINIITKSENRIELGVGEFNAKKLIASVAKNIGNWTLGGSLSYLKDDGESYSDVFDRNGLQSTTQDPKEVTQVRAAVQNDKTQFFGQYLTSKRSDYYLFRRLRDDVTEIKLNHLILGIDHTFIDVEEMALSFSTSYQYAERESLTALVPRGEAPFEQVDFLFGESLNYRSLNLGLDGKYQVSDSFIINAGLFFSQSQIPDGFIKSNFDLYGDFTQLDQVVTFTEDDQRVVLDKERIIKSAYLQSQLDLSENLIFTLGLRYDAYNDVDNSLTPRAALIYHIDNEQTVKLLYGQAYRAPSLGDLYDEESGLTFGNQDLHASEIETIEAVYIKTLEQLQLTMTVFSNDQKNIIGFRPDDEGNQLLDNVAANQVYGFDFETIWQPTVGFRVKASLTHLWKNDTDLGQGIGIPRSEEIAPKSYANFTLQYYRESWSFNLNGNWRSEVNELDSGDLWLVNTNISRNLSENFKVIMTISNLLDKNFSTSSYVSLGTDEQGNNVQKYPGRGRQAFLNINYRF
ncbi:MAG: TonB-dependent receptor [Colwellia sp.]|nr:TonB-dependent receptor [Colwellia sp.]